MIAASTTLVRTDQLVSAPLGEELAMMDLDSGSYYLLDDIASFIWTSLSHPTEVTALLEALQERYDVAPERCAVDVLGFLGHLHEKGLVRQIG